MVYHCGTSTTSQWIIIIIIVVVVIHLPNYNYQGEWAGYAPSDNDQSNEFHDHERWNPFRHTRDGGNRSGRNHHDVVVIVVVQGQSVFSPTQKKIVRAS